MSEVIYLYGFVPAGTTAPDGLAGVAGAPVEVIAGNGFGVAVGRVPSDRYGAVEVEAKLRDLEWVGEQGLRHEQVVAWFTDHGQIVPARLLTLYSTLDALRAETGGRAEEIRERLRRFAGRREWDLKVSYRADALVQHIADVSEAVRELDARIAEATPGRRFLLERRRAEVVRTEAAHGARRIASELLDGLRELAIDVRPLPLPRDADALPVVLNAALLVAAENDSELQRRSDERVERLAGLGIDAVLSGPWAPYRFLGEDE